MSNQRLDLTIAIRRSLEESSDVVGKDSLIYSLISYMTEAEVEDFVRKFTPAINMKEAA